jgi:uncharacterized membrane protein YkvA (DUF1232 family)
MLFSLVNKINNTIRQLDVGQAAPAFLEQIAKNRPDFISEIRGAAPDVKTADTTLIALACGYMSLLKEIPDMADFLASVVKNRSVHPAIRCSVAGILVYLVQPNDLIPDNSPGGYGLIDDCAILRTGMIEYLQMTSNPDRSVDDELKYVRMLTQIVSLDVLAPLQATIESMSISVQLIQLLPPEMIESTLQTMIQNPLASPAVQQPQGFAPRPAPDLGNGRWSGGAYFEDGNVVIPGGPSLIDGELFIPQY